MVTVEPTSWGCARMKNDYICECLCQVPTRVELEKQSTNFRGERELQEDNLIHLWDFLKLGNWDPSWRRPLSKFHGSLEMQLTYDSRTAARPRCPRASSRVLSALPLCWGAVLSISGETCRPSSQPPWISWFWKVHSGFLPPGRPCMWLLSGDNF